MSCGTLRHQRQRNVGELYGAMRARVLLPSRVHIGEAGGLWRVRGGLPGRHSIPPVGAGGPNVTAAIEPPAASVCDGAVPRWVFLHEWEPYAVPRRKVW